MGNAAFCCQATPGTKAAERIPHWNWSPTPSCAENPLPCHTAPSFAPDG